MALRREKAGIFVSEWRNFGLTAHASWAWHAGFRWICLHGHAGPNAPEEGHPSSDFIQNLRRIGFEVGCWGTFGSDSDPKQSAYAANGIITHLGYSFYVANIEAPYPDREFIKAFRSIPGREKFTIWLSSEISNPRDWKAWFKPGELYAGSPVATAWLPQCYTQVNPNATPKSAHFWAVRTDNPPGGNRYIPRDAVKPTVGEWESALKDPLAYKQELQDTALGPGGATLGPGFSLYLGETTPSGYYQKFQNLIDSGLALK